MTDNDTQLHWIPVTQELPAEDELVLLWDGHVHVLGRMVYWNAGVFAGKPLWWVFNFLPHDSGYTPTHWARISKP